MPRVLIGIILVFQALLVQAGPEVLTVEDVCREFPEKVIRLFDALDLGRKELAAAKEAVEGKDWPGACRALLDSYRSSPWAGKMRVERKMPTGQRGPAADLILNDNYTLYEVTAKVPRRSDGGLDWTYNGPTGDREWGWGLNRQRWIETLLSAYSGTGNPVYMTALDQLLRDWVTSNPYPAKKNNTPQWRGLEVFMRVAFTWPETFYGLQEFPEFTPAARILMLSSIPDHAHYNRNFHSESGNWITMELRGLASAAVYWPEFRDANAWFEYATERITPELTNQVYPDGAQKELTSTYHRVSLNSFDEFIKLAEAAGLMLPDVFASCVERMWNYLAYTMNPSGYGPLNNDADLDPVGVEICTQANLFKRPDWSYIATNGTQGERPEDPPSVVFPWARQVIMRSGWDADSHWAFFDVGPMGIGHWHLDKLHLSVNAYGRDILVDGGRFTYQSGPWRDYFVGSGSHNVILIDGHQQKGFEKESKEPMSGNFVINPEYDLARGVFDNGYEDVEGSVTHERTVLYVRNGYWLVLDRIMTDRPHEVTALWHYHPSCTVVADKLSVASIDEGKGNASVTPSSGMEWKLEIVKGREIPRPQGWWSRKYNIKEPSACAAYTAQITGPVTFAWLITPAKGSVPKGVVTIDETSCDFAKVRVDLAEQPSRTWRIRWGHHDVSVE
jgi:hypothetical protein